MSREIKEDKRQEGIKMLTFPCQLAVVGLFAGNDLLHQLVVAAVAHCLDDVSHLETNTKMVEMHFYQSRGKSLDQELFLCYNIKEIKPSGRMNFS